MKPEPVQRQAAIANRKIRSEAAKHHAAPPRPWWQRLIDWFVR